MKILAVDTSATAASVCIAEENKIIGESFINTALTHSQTLIPMVEQLLDNTNTSLKDVDAIAVNAGPGSFTGVRIGVAAVKGLAFADNIPCISISTLECMAYNMLGSDCIVCAAMDARCSQVYNALFKVSGEQVERICADRALSLDELAHDLQRFNQPIVLVGDGAEICVKYFENSSVNAKLAPVNKRIQTASSTACAAIKEALRGNTVSAEELMPTYLRLPQAQRELNKKLGVKK